jgi:putative ABC transport system substrate-binding protein
MEGIHEGVPEGQQEGLAESLSAGVTSPRLAVLRPVPPTRAVRRGFRVHRRTFLRTVAGSLLTAPLAADAQPGPTVRRIGVVGGTVPDQVETRKEGLRRLGWIEGQNIVVEFVRTGDESGARDLVRLKVEVIMASNNPSIAAAKAATTTIPIVMVYGDDPVRQGYVASLARPSGNITGRTSTAAPETLGESWGKRIELLAECRPGLSRLAILMDPDFPSYRTFYLGSETAARSRGMAVQPVEVREVGELPGALARMVEKRALAIHLIGSPIFYNVRGQIAELAVRHRLPCAYPWREGPDAGGLLSYGPNLQAAWHRAAVYVDKILKGAKPADLPVEQPTQFELVINLKTAKALGLTIPQSLLQRADQVIE